LSTVFYYSEGHEGQSERSLSTLKFLLVMAFVAASLGFRFISYVSKAAALFEALQQIEFDGLFGDLYNKEVGRNSPGIYIHYSPRITLGVIGAGILGLPLLLTRQSKWTLRSATCCYFFWLKLGSSCCDGFLSYVPTFQQRSIYSGGL
jgi:hypothetical protein